MFKYLPICVNHVHCMIRLILQFKHVPLPDISKKHALLVHLFTVLLVNQIYTFNAFKICILTRSIELLFEKPFVQALLTK